MAWKTPLTIFVSMTTSINRGFVNIVPFKESFHILKSRQIVIPASVGQIQTSGSLIRSGEVIVDDRPVRGGVYQFSTKLARLHCSNKMALNQRFIFAKRFVGEPKPSDFEFVEESIPALKDKEIHCEAIALSVDPYMRPYSAAVPVGVTMFGEQVAKVVESRHPDYKVGDLVVGYFGWQTHFVGNPEEVITAFGKKAKPAVLPDLHGLPPSYALGALGMPGNTAYFGFLEICEPKPGKTLVVSGAAGAVGSHVGQIGKIIGLKVIGFAGSDDKVEYLTKELKFDYAFNYKKTSVKEALKLSAKDGVDYYFDNVGGEMSSEIMTFMNDFGRISVCGAISAYNEDKPPKVSAVQFSLITKQLRMEGFIVNRWLKRWFEGIQKNLVWIKEGKLIVREHRTQGFKKMPEAFIGMLRGENTGKAVVIV